MRPLSRRCRAYRVDAGTRLARDGILLSTLSSPVFIFVIAALLG
ncbi:hypothetical protein [Bifidobacterium miconis]|nr:hypothetical protein [Bifidobacterium miconis]